MHKQTTCQDKNPMCSCCFIQTWGLEPVLPFPTFFTDLLCQYLQDDLQEAIIACCLIYNLENCRLLLQMMFQAKRYVGDIFHWSLFYKADQISHYLIDRYLENDTTIKLFTAKHTMKDKNPVLNALKHEQLNILSRLPRKWFDECQHKDLFYRLTSQTTDRMMLRVYHRFPKFAKWVQTEIFSGKNLIHTSAFEKVIAKWNSEFMLQLLLSVPGYFHRDLRYNLRLLGYLASSKIPFDYFLLIWDTCIDEFVFNPNDHNRILHAAIQHHNRDVLHFLAQLHNFHLTGEHEVLVIIQHFDELYGWIKQFKLFDARFMQPSLLCRKKTVRAVNRFLKRNHKRKPYYIRHWLIKSAEGGDWDLFFHIYNNFQNPDFSSKEIDAIWKHALSSNLNVVKSVAELDLSQILTETHLEIACRNADGKCGAEIVTWMIDTLNIQFISKQSCILLLVCDSKNKFDAIKNHITDPHSCNDAFGCFCNEKNLTSTHFELLFSLRKVSFATIRKTRFRRFCLALYKNSGLKILQYVCTLSDANNERVRVCDVRVLIRLADSEANEGKLELKNWLENFKDQDGHMLFSHYRRDRRHKSKQHVLEHKE